MNFIWSTAPAWVALVSWAFLGEHLGRTKTLALIVTMLGLVGVATAGGGVMRPSGAAIGWGLLSSLSYGSLYLFGKWYFARYSPATVFVHALPVAALVLFPLATFHAKSPVAWTALIALAVFSTYGAYLAYSAGLGRLTATRAATVATVEPVFGAALSFAFWGERFAPLGYAAAILVLAGVVMMANDSTAVSESDGVPSPTP